MSETEIPMEKAIEELSRVLAEKETLEPLLGDIELRVGEFRKQVEAEYKGELERLKTAEETEARMRCLILHKWKGTYGETKAATASDLLLTMKTLRKVEIKDEKALLNELIAKGLNPWTPKWDNKKLEALINGGAISESLATIEAKQSLSVQRVKP